jgi:hypothetical protein
MSNYFTFFIFLFSRVILPKGYFALCSGTLAKEILYEEENKRKFVYEINAAVSIDFLGIVCGIFKNIRVNSLDPIYIFYSAFSEGTTESDRLASTSDIIKDARQFMEIYSQNFNFNLFSLVFLPGIASITEFTKCFSFLNVGILAEKNFCDKYRIENFQKNKREIFRTLNESLLRAVLKIDDYRRDGWIITGSLFYGWLNRLGGFLSK